MLLSWHDIIDQSCQNVGTLDLLKTTIKELVKTNKLLALIRDG